MSRASPRPRAGGRSRGRGGERKKKCAYGAEQVLSSDGEHHSLTPSPRLACTFRIRKFGKFDPTLQRLSAAAEARAAPGE